MAETIRPADALDEPMLRFFEYAHLPERLQVASKPFCETARTVVSTTPRNPERTVCLRKLLEAKDCAVRAILTLALVALALPGCAGLTPAGVSPSTAGAPATAGQLAQTVSGQQGQAPSTATGGTSTIVWNFASTVASETAGRIMEIAAEQRWTADQLTEALRAAAGAPQTVNITTQTNSSNGGNASSIPAGTGGAAGVGGAGTVSKP